MENPRDPFNMASRRPRSPSPAERRRRNRIVNSVLAFNILLALLAMALAIVSFAGVGN